jgi:predicted esterase
VRVILLHGRMMEAADLEPFTRSLGIDAEWLVPDAPLAASPRGRTWWPVDSEEHARRVAAGPTDLHAMDPAGRAEARAFLDAHVDDDTVLVGFSQGGMLAMDYALHERVPRAIALLSSTRIAWSQWQPRLACAACRCSSRTAAPIRSCRSPPARTCATRRSRVART